MSAYFDGNPSVMYGGVNEMDALIYGIPRPETLMQMQHRVDNIMSWSQQLTDAGREFFSQATSIFEQFNGQDAIRAARMALQRAGSVFQKNEIRVLSSLGELQVAPLLMQRWVMAQIDARKLFHEQRCDGYSGTYEDVHPGDIGEQHYDYRRVMQGVVQPETEENGEWKIRHYYDELLPGDRELTHNEKSDIITTWDLVAHYLKGSEDPTSPYGGSL